MQSNCIFPGRFAPLTYYDRHRGHEYAITGADSEGGLRSYSRSIFTIYGIVESING